MLPPWLIMVSYTTYMIRIRLTVTPYMSKLVVSDITVLISQSPIKDSPVSQMLKTQQSKYLDQRNHHLICPISLLVDSLELSLLTASYMTVIPILLVDKLICILRSTAQTPKRVVILQITKHLLCIYVNKMSYLILLGLFVLKELYDDY